MTSHPFSTIPYSISDIGNGLAWMGDPIPLNYMLKFFYDVHRFKVFIGTSGTGGTIGLTTRQMQSPPQILNLINVATKKASSPSATQTDKNNLSQLILQAESAAAPGEGQTFLRAYDINTKGNYPIHSYSHNQSSIRLDFGSVRMIGGGMQFPNPRNSIPTYNRYNFPLFAPAAWALAGNVGSLSGASMVGIISLGLDSDGGYDITLFGSGSGEDFASGNIYPREYFSDLKITPAFGQKGTTVQIGVLPNLTSTNISTVKCFSGFKNVKRVSYNGFDVTNSFSFKSETLGFDSSLNANVVNESCTVQIPNGAQSGYFTFYSESAIDGTSGNTICDQFTIPQKFIVTF